MIQFWMLNTLTRPSKNPQAAVVCRQGASMRSPRSWWVTRPVLFAVLFAVLVGQLRHTTNQVDCYFMATKIEDLPIFPVYFFWLHVPHFCLLGWKKDFKSDDFLFFLKTYHWSNVPTVTYSNLEFFSTCHDTGGVRNSWEESLVRVHAVLWIGFSWCSTGMNMAIQNTIRWSFSIPSQSLTARPWKVIFPIGKDRLLTTIFQGVNSLLNFWCVI